MKRLLIISILLLSVGSSQNRVNVNNLVQYGDKYFKENDDKPFNGIVFDLSKETGNKILEYKMIEGLKNGLYQEWYSDGKLKRKGKYLNNTQVGDWTVWYYNGQMKFELTSKMKVTLFNYWYEGGQKRSEGHWEDGKKVGKWFSWHSNGQVESEGFYIDDQKDGLWVSYDETGTKVSEEAYAAGALINNSSLE